MFGGENGLGWGGGWEISRIRLGGKVDSPRSWILRIGVKSESFASSLPKVMLKVRHRVGSILYKVVEFLG